MCVCVCGKHQASDNRVKTRFHICNIHRCAHLRGMELWMMRSDAHKYKMSTCLLGAQTHRPGVNVANEKQQGTGGGL